MSLRLLLVALLVLVGCGGQAADPSERVVSVTTTACGHASRTTGAGVLVDDGWALVSAHVVAGAGSVEVAGSFGTGPAEIVVFDVDADLALLQVPPGDIDPVVVAAAGAGDTLEIAGGGPSGAIETRVLRPVDVRIEAVRSNERTSRLGYEIDTRVALGDSGAGAFDEEHRLVGIVFGRSLAGIDRSFIVRHEEIARVLSADRSTSWVCDPAQHRVVAAP